MEDKMQSFEVEPKQEQISYLEDGKPHTIVLETKIIKTVRTPTDIEDNAPHLGDSSACSILLSTSDKTHPSFLPDELSNDDKGERAETQSDQRGPGVVLAPGEPRECLTLPIQEAVDDVARKKTNVHGGAGPRGAEEVDRQDQDGELCRKKRSKNKETLVTAQKASKADCKNKNRLKKNPRNGTELRVISEMSASKIDKAVKHRPQNQSHLCNICNETFATQKALKNHELTHTREVGYACNICTKRYKSKHYLREHILAHSGATFKCETCDKSFAQYGYLRSHLQIHKLKGSHVTCNECGQRFTRNTGLKLHMETTHSKVKPFVCGTCNKAFPKQYLLNKHAKNHAEQKPLSCDLCGKSFSKPSNMARHIASHTPGELFPCRICGQRFKSNAYLKTHFSTTHDGSSKCFTCNECGMTFRLGGTLKRHLRTHSGTKEFRCKVCNKEFTAKSNLVRHALTHSNERPSVCDECGETFKTDQMLRRHVNVAHGSERTVSCKFCNKKFADKHDLWSHAICHGDRRFLCEVCGKGFKRKVSLKLHVGSHGAAKLLSCTVCNRVNAFSTMGTYRRHMKEKHPGKYKCGAKS